MPIERYFKEGCSPKTVFYHFSMWCKDGSWKSMGLNQLKQYRNYLDLSSIQLYGSQTRANRGGEKVGFQFRKAVESTNFLYLCDNQGVLIAISEPIRGEHQDLSEIKSHLQYLMNWLEKADIRTDRLFLYANAGFDSQECRNICQTYQIETNIDFNPRNGSIKDRYEYSDEILCQNRFVMERAFDWLDAFKALLIRFEIKSLNWLCLNIIGLAVFFTRKINRNLEYWTSSFCGYVSKCIMHC